MRSHAEPRPTGTEGHPHLVRAAPVLLGIAGVAGSLLLLVTLRSAEERDARAEFELTAAESLAHVYRQVTTSLELVHSTLDLFRSSDDVEAEEFKTFTERNLGRDGALRAMLLLERPPSGAARA